MPDVSAAWLMRAGVPLPKGKTAVLEEGVDWEELVWGPSYVRVRGHEYPLQRLLYVPYSVAA